MLKTVSDKLHQFLLDNSYTLSIAESITGGRIASEIVSHSGASHYFIGSITAYSNHIKEQLLGVSRTLIEKEGAVSCAVAEEMALGAQRLFKTDLSISTTGVAGPAGETINKPIGFICFGIAFNNNFSLRTKSPSEKRKDDRDTKIVTKPNSSDFVRKMSNNVISWTRKFEGIRTSIIDQASEEALRKTYELLNQ